MSELFGMWGCDGDCMATGVMKRFWGIPSGTHYSDANDIDINLSLEAMQNI